MDKASEKKMIFLLILLSILIKSGVLLLGLEFLIKNAVILDDTFIGLSVGYNMFLGNGFSFNGIEATTGNPVVWSSLLSLFGFLGRNNLAIFSILLSGIIFSLSGFFVYKISKNLWNSSGSSLIIMSLFLFNPFLFILSINGLETSLFVFFLVFGLHFYIKNIRNGDYNIKNLILFSIILALATYTREEGNLVLLAYLADLFLIKKSKYKKIFLLIICYGLLLSPLFLWRYLSFREIPSSNFYFFLNSPILGQYGFLLRRIGEIALIAYMVNLMLGNFLVSLAGFLTKKIKEIENLRPLIFYSILNFLFYSLVITSAKFRYVFPAAILGTFGIGLLLYEIKGRLSSWLAGGLSFFVFSLVIVAFIGFVSISAMICWTGIGYCGDSEVAAAKDDIYFYDMAKYVDKSLPPDTRIAAGHIGTLGYFSNRVVIDAGGKVDFESINAMRQGKLLEYLQSKNVSYVVRVVSQETVDKAGGDVLYKIPIYQKNATDLLGYLITHQQKPTGNFVALLKLKEDYISS